MRIQLSPGTLPCSNVVLPGGPRSIKASWRGMPARRLSPMMIGLGVSSVFPPLSERGGGILGPASSWPCCAPPSVPGGCCATVSEAVERSGACASSGRVCPKTAPDAPPGPLNWFISVTTLASGDIVGSMAAWVTSPLVPPPRLASLRWATCLPRALVPMTGGSTSEGRSSGRLPPTRIAAKALPNCPRIG
jgi:hypothetical protein